MMIAGQRACGWKRLSAIALAAAIALGVAACSAGSGAQGGASGGSGAAADATSKVVYGSSAPLVTFDPARSQAGGEPSTYMSMVYDTLVTVDAQGNTAPDLASSWTQNSLTEYTFTLRTGVTYQDGSAFNATTAMKSLDRSIKANGPRRAELAPIASVRALNPTTLRITLKTPDPDLLLTLATPPGAMLSPEAFSRPNLDLDPDGTGPFTYDAADSVAGDHYAFTANPRWWDRANVTRSQSVVIEVLSNTTARLNALKSGQVDIATVPAQDAAEARQSGLDIASRANTWSGLTILDRQGKTVPALGSPLVREAMALALNRQSLVQALSYGYADASDQVFAKGTPGYDPALQSKYAYDPQKARQLIAESGFKNITFTAPIAAAAQSAAEALKSELAAIGVTMNLQVEPPSALSPIARTTKFPVATFGSQNNDPFGRYVALWAPDATFNPFHVDNPALDRQAREFALATTPAQQNRIAMEMNDEVISSGTVIVASQPDDLAAYSPRLQGVRMSPAQTPVIVGAHF